MKSVDEPESPAFSPDGQTIAFAALRDARRRHLHRRPRRRKQVTNLTDDDFADCAPTLFARRQVHHLQRARQRQPEAVPARSRHARRRRRSPSAPQDETGGAVHRRPHDRVLVDGHRSERCRSSRRSRKNGNIYNIWTLDLKNGELRQYTDALGGNWSPVVLNEGKTSQHRVRQLLQGRVQHPHARAQGAAAHRGDVGLRRARPDHRLPGAAAAHAGGREQPQEGHVREDVPRGPAAGERRRHQQRRHLRRHAGQLRRRARRQAVQLLRRVDLAVPHAVARPTSTCRAASSARCRATRRRSSSTDSSAACSTIRRSRRSSAAIDAIATRTVRGGTRVRHLPAQTATAASSCPAASCSSNEAVQRSRRCSRLAQTTSSQLYGAAGLPQRHADAARRRVRPGDDGLPRVRTARRQHDAARLRRLAEDRRHCCRARRFDGDARHYLRLGGTGPARDAHPRLQEHRRLPRLPVLRRQLRAARLRLPRSSPARTSCSPTPSCASR